MPHRIISVTIPPNSNQIALPVGTAVGAELSVEHDVPDQQGLNIALNPSNSEIANISPSMVERRVTIKIEQDVPFFPTEPIGVSDWKNKYQYKVGHHVWYKGRIYRCTVSHNPNGATYLDPTKWVNTSGDTGCIITLAPMMTSAIPEGCWALDGSIINAPWSPLHGKSTPNLSGKVVVAAGGSSYVHGGTSGADSYNIVVANLPTTQFSISATAAGASAGTPSGTVTGTTTTNGYHYHTLYSADSGTGSYIDHDKSGSSSSIQSYSNSIGGAGDHAHTFSGSLVGNAMANHTHPVSGSVTLNTGSQSGFSVRQPSVHCTMFVRL